MLNITHVVIKLWHVIITRAWRWLKLVMRDIHTRWRRHHHHIKCVLLRMIDAHSHLAFIACWSSSKINVFLALQMAFGIKIVRCDHDGCGRQLIFHVSRYRADTRGLTAHLWLLCLTCDYVIIAEICNNMGYVSSQNSTCLNQGRNFIRPQVALFHLGIGFWQEWLGRV